MASRWLGKKEKTESKKTPKERKDLTKDAASSSGTRHSSTPTDRDKKKLSLPFKRKDSKSAKKSRNSSSVSSLSPTSATRNSPVMESKLSPTANVDVTGKGSTEISHQGELFNDDPRTVSMTETCLSDSQTEEVRQTIEVETELIECELKKKEDEMNIQVKSKSTVGRIRELFSAYEQKSEQEKNGLQEQLRRATAEKQGMLMTKVSELRKDIERLKIELEEEKQSYKASTKKVTEEFTKDGLREIERLKQKCVHVEEEKQREVQSRKEAMKQLRKLHKSHKDDIEQKTTLKGKVSKLEEQCTEQEHKITGSTARMQGLQKTIGSYESKVMKLEKQIHEEERLRKICEEELKTMKEEAVRPLEHSKQETDKDAMMQELKTKEEEISHKLKRTEELLTEQKTKGEESQHKSEALQKAKEEELEEIRHKLKRTEELLMEQEMKGEESQCKSEALKKAKEEELEEISHKLKRTEELLTEQTTKGEESQHKLEALQKTKEEESEEIRLELKRTEELLMEQETKREESQRKLEALQKAMKKLETSSKTSAELEDYFDNVTKLCEELTEMKKQSEMQKKEIANLKRMEANAKKIEEECIMKTEELSKMEAKVQLLNAEVKRRHVREECSTEPKDTGSTVTSSTDESMSSSEDPRTLKKLNREIKDLKEKLKARDEELHGIKQGNNPLSNPPISPTDSMAASSGEVAAFRQQLKEKEQEFKNMRAQITSMEGVLKQREELEKEAERLKKEVSSLSHEKQGLSQHIKKQSREVFSLKEKLKTSQIVVVSEPQQEERLKKHDHTADDRYDGTQELKAQLEVLTKERDHFREQASQKASAFEKAKEQAKKYEHLCIEVAALKDTADQMKSTCAWYEAENKKLEEMVKDIKIEKVDAVTAEKEGNALASHQIQKELERLREESHQKDLILQSVAEEAREKEKRLEELQEKLDDADARYKGLAECNEDLIRNKHQMAQDELERKDDRIAELEQELKAKVAQVKQYKKQVEKEKGDDKQNPEGNTQEVENLQLELAKSRSVAEEAEQRFKAVSHKNAELEAHYRKKVAEKEHELRQLLERNNALLAQVSELSTKQQLLKKETELQLVQAQQQQTGMATELSRMQKERKREDEFSKAFQQEFDANRVLRGECEKLREELDTAMDSLDGLRQQQEVLKMTLKYNNIPLPFVEPEPRPATQQIVKETPHYPPHVPVAISQKPIASPGVYNQQVEDVRYMPPHSNAESQYKEQQLAQQQRNIRQHQQDQFGHHQGPPNPSQAPQAHPNIPLHHISTVQSNTYEVEPVVGIPPSAAAARLQPYQLPHTSQLPLQSRHSEGEIQQDRFARQVVGNMHQPSYPQPMEPIQPQPSYPQHVEPTQPQASYPPQVEPMQQQPSHLKQVEPHYPMQLEVQQSQQPFQPAATTIEAGVTRPGNLPPQPHSGYQHPPALQSTIPNPSQDDTYAQSHATNPPPVSSTFVTPVPESTSNVLQGSTPATVDPVATVGCGAFQKPPDITASNVAAPSQPILPMTRNDSEQSAGGEGLMRNLNGAIADTVAKVNENEYEGGAIVSPLQSLPQDPNLQCVVCGKVFKIGEIQKYRRHVETCTGS